ncbi:MAG: GNAT family N-acetyltransferase [Bacteroidales bacterium]|nr:GNAT family N-acetyltransferase [Candidatus Sodaliphilus aphodohippi]
MEQIIDAVETSLIERELSADKLLRTTNKAGNVIYVVTAHNAPNTMREIGRLREIAFRSAGGGTGKACDIDEFDLMETPCKQLLVWNPERRDIVGAYRFIRGCDVARNDDGTLRIAMGHMFAMSERFVSEFLPRTIELGRSFVSLDYQSTRAGNKAIFALDNLWDGLGALCVLYPEMKYFFGKMTMYPSYDRDCRDRLLEFMSIYFPDKDGLIVPIEVASGCNPRNTGFFAGNDFKEDYKLLNAFIRQHGINIPPLVNAYMSLSPSMRVFGTAINRHFGDVEETGILIGVDDITEQKKSRHIDTFVPNK